MEKKINAPIKTNRFLETNAYSVAIFEVENNSNIDTKLYLPVFDFREEVNENLSVVHLKELIKNVKRIGNTVFPQTQFGRTLVDTFTPFYGFDNAKRRFMFSESWMELTVQAAWIFYDTDAIGRYSIDSHLQFGIDTVGLTKIIIKINFGQTVDRITHGPTWITLKIGTRSANIDATLHNNGFVEVPIILATGQSWLDVSISLTKRLNNGHRPFAVLSVQLYDSFFMFPTQNQ